MFRQNSQATENTLFIGDPFQIFTFGSSSPYSIAFINFGDAFDRLFLPHHLQSDDPLLHVVRSHPRGRGSRPGVAGHAGTYSRSRSTDECPTRERGSRLDDDISTEW